ncbi:zinc ribbon domain-containing protein [Cupriavidus sp. 8B]
MLQYKCDDVAAQCLQLNISQSEAFRPENCKPLARNPSPAAAGYGCETCVAPVGAAAGVWFEEVEEALSTQTCSCCGSPTAPKGVAGLGVRGWTCGACGTVHERDVNAAKNIRARGRAPVLLALSAAAVGRGQGGRQPHQSTFLNPTPDEITYHVLAHCQSRRSPRRPRIPGPRGNAAEGVAPDWRSHREGAQSIAFPESFNPGFPVWAALWSPIYNHDWLRSALKRATMDGFVGNQCKEARDGSARELRVVRGRDAPAERTGRTWSYR